VLTDAAINRQAATSCSASRRTSIIGKLIPAGTGLRPLPQHPGAAHRGGAARPASSYEDLELLASFGRWCPVEADFGVPGVRHRRLTGRFSWRSVGRRESVRRLLHRPWARQVDSPGDQRYDLFNHYDPPPRPPPLPKCSACAQPRSTC
jgi:hypothetical protein